MYGMTVRALNGIDLEIQQGEVLGVLGESGSGKTVLIHSAMRILPDNAKVEGKIVYRGKNLLEIGEREAKAVIGKHFALIPQAFNSLNPVLMTGFQIGERSIEHFGRSKPEAVRLAERLFASLGLSESRRAALSYPHQLSGGMRQRALVAMGISEKSDIVFIDEPTKGVDANKKRSIVALLKKVRTECDPTMVIISHDLDFLREISDRICVLYCGDILEVSPKDAFFRVPLHPYSQALLESMPSSGLRPIEGKPPSMISPPSGCRFHPRCSLVQELCKRDRPPLTRINDVMVRCIKYAK